jgi:hypothetical protein
MEVHNSLGSTELKIVVKLVEAMLEDAKDLMVYAGPEDLVRAQGEARSFAAFLKIIKRPPLPVPVKE